MKTLNKIFRQDKEKFKIPKSVQDIIPIKMLWKDGIFLTQKNKYTKTYKFLDINYAVASKEDKEIMFIDYSELLNSLDTGAITKITINNRRINKIEFEKKILLDYKNDNLDKYRKEYNDMLLEQIKEANGIIQEKLITISVYKETIEEARMYFNRIGSELSTKFNKLGSKCIELNANERLQILYDFYRIGEESSFRFELSETMKKGHNFKDYICPDSFEFKDDFFKMGNKFGRVLFLKEYANFIKDSMLTELTELNKNMMLSIDVIPIPSDEAIKEAENRRLGIETNITNWERKQNANNNFSAMIPYDMELQRNESKEFLDDLTLRDQRMFLSILTLVIIANTKEELDNSTEEVLQIARKGLCQLGILRFQQLDGLNLVLPITSNFSKIKALRTLTTESLAIFMPFKVQEVIHENGLFYGQNIISKNMIIADRRKLLNGNSFILGVSGSGKSFAAKEEITSIRLRDKDADIIIIDPEREQSHLVKALGGEVIEISATSNNHINALDMSKDYGDGANPIILKSEFILSLCEQLVGNDNLGAKEKSIIDRCTSNTYRFYQQGNYQGIPPTLIDFREELLKQKEPEAQEIALAIELFTNGNLNTFAKNTNVDTKNNLICFDILDLGKQLLPIRNVSYFRQYFK